MTELSRTEFRAIRNHIKIDLDFDDVVALLLDRLGHTPVDLEQIGKDNKSWPAYEAEVKRHQGSSGFMLFGLIDHGGWISKAGISLRVLRITFGNPLIAITMLKHDITAGLFVPIECLVTEEGAGTTITYLQPSTLIAQDETGDLLNAAKDLDCKVENLMADVVRWAS